MLRSKPIFRDIFLIVTLWLLVLVFFWRIFTPNLADKMRFAGGDFSHVFYPARYYVAKSLWQGRLPLWNPHVAGGYPHYADPQAATFYPISLATALLSKGELTIDLLQVEAVFHFLLATTFTYLFTRHLVGNKLAAFTAALVFAFSGYLTSYPPVQLSVLEAAVWLPLILWLVTLAVDRRCALYSAMGGMALAMVFLAGCPQSYLNIGSLTLAWLLYRSHARDLSWGQTLFYTASLATFALGMAMVQAIPTYELTRLSSRASFSYAVASEGGFSPWELGGIISPQAFGSAPLYVGLATLFLAALAIAKGRGLFWLATAFAGLLVSLGKYTFGMVTLTVINGELFG